MRAGLLLLAYQEAERGHRHPTSGRPTMKHTTRRAGAKAPLKRLTTGLRVFPEAFRPGQLARVAVLPGGLRCQLRFVTQLFRMKGKLEEKDIDATAAGLRLFTPKGEEEELGRGVGKMWRADTSAPATALLPPPQACGSAALVDTLMQGANGHSPRVRPPQC